MPVVIAFAFPIANTLAQQTLEDSLLRKINALPEGKERIELLYQLAGSPDIMPVRRPGYAKDGLAMAQKLHDTKQIAAGYERLARVIIQEFPQKIDSAESILSKSLTLAKQGGFADVEVLALFDKSLILVTKEKFPEALVILEQSAQVAESTQNRLLLSKAYGQLAVMYQNNYMYSTALDYAQKAWDALTPTDDEVTRGDALYRLGSCYETVGQHAKSLLCFRKVAKIYARHRLYRSLGGAMLNIAGELRSLRLYDESMMQTRLNIAFAKKHGRRNILASALTSAATWHAQHLQFDSAITCLTSANRIWDELGYAGSPFYIDNLSNLGNCLCELKNFDTGIATLNKAHALGKKIRNYDCIKRSLIYLDKVYTRMNDLKNIIRYRSEQLRLSDSLNSAEHNREMARAEFRYGLDKARRESELHVFESAQDKELIQQKTRGQFILAGLLLVVTIGSLFVIYLYRTRMKLINELNLKNETIKHQSEELATTLENNIRMQNQLIHSEKMASLGQLTAGIAHEINNPLNFINGGATSIEIVQEKTMRILRNPSLINDREVKEIEEEMKSLIDVIQNGVRRTTNIVRNLKTFSSPVSHINDESRISIIESVEGAVTLLQNKIKYGSIQVRINIDHDLTARANEGLIQQVLANIIDNAVQALENKAGERIITIKGAKKGGSAIITIHDNGPGIPKEHQHAIMDPFFTTKDVGKGTGLGLYISYGIIQKHEGTLSFTSSAEAGTEFTIALPLQKA